MMPCTCCPAEHLFERMVHLMNHDRSARHATEPHGAATADVLMEANQQEENFSDYGSSTSALDISGFIMHILLVLRAIRDEQQTNFRVLSEQIVHLNSELRHVARNNRIISKQTTNVRRRWDPSQYFPIDNVEQLKRIDEVCEQMENYPHIVDLRKTLEKYCRDENATRTKGFYQLFDETFALQLVVTEQDTSFGYIPLDRYESFFRLLKDSWRLCNTQGKHIDRRLRHFFSLNRRKLDTNDEERCDFEQDNPPTEIQFRNSFNKRTSSDYGSDVSEPSVKRRHGSRFEVKRRKRNAQKD